MKISFLGTGQMGQRMCLRLLNAGYEVHLYNRTKSKMESLIKKGAIPHDSVFEACQDSDLAISMVRDDNASSELWNMDMLVALKAKNIRIKIMECSTLSAEWTQELAARFNKLGIDFITCPVIGSLIPAEQGQLILLPGGPQDLIHSIEPVLLHLGNKIFHYQHPEDSAVAKLAVNFFFASQVNLLFESMKILMKNSNISQDQSMSLFQALPILSAPLIGMTEMTRQGNYNPAFPVELVSKDLGYFKHLSFNQAQMALINIVNNSFNQAIDRGEAKANINSIWKNEH